MPPLRGLGFRTQLGTSDTNLNANPFLPGTGWNVIFQPQDLAATETEFEVYQISLNGPIGASGLVAVDGHPWNYVAQFWSNTYDPQQPLLVKFGQSVQFFWNVAFAAGPYNMTTNIQPTVTMWLRRTSLGLLEAGG
jgi:hypothetical protein